ncbi:oxygen-independent coproporphyrinogen III oxidase [Alloalcanivorax xenomutans]|jgi:oxygen-independent coproporphyrinogen III oxidase|uniref:Coproporphyrinogen-III oxidase n=1 Tax=Alloalcanivorax xenomutans TaxID=1094342 RepID=A0A9Q3ZFW3_9GAMM|nr:oxygen-independent coproporphyrinogen III oxidase [Alloalcanivorax xenomutans]ERS14086.1 coproporphyrinogen III oxidase [Alcanivorax sp. PN-3]MBA4720306.1 oxygen-independent coproporphyrinogen III oxidase [Alcanivorax sp.]ARB45865.1 coproporphyrinogen III oxidase [Alloalcanivorax xenomutans]MCE7510166.1 oxygen-independent coproporphyrinogen III oxidase [Alloalcanivorax xenomutans]MCE7523890.1 oxygen-independent coproporphyrinogen III oxidase [Alloalcanivorax xenomutans]
MTQWNPDLIRRFGGPGPRYTSYPPATQFHEEVGEEDYRRAVARGNQARRPLSLYCHIPFCATVCYYCACNRIITGNRAKAEDYLTFLKQEIKAKAALVDPQRPVVQMHWGGGTPTYLSDAQMTELVYDLARHFNLLEEDRGEYAIEVDPRTVDRARLGLLRGLGFNRLSIGIQDLDPVVQKAVNREQSLELITEVFDAARDFGFHSINADMIYGLPWQSSSSLARSLEQLLALRPERISLYNYAHMPARFKVQRQIQETALPSPEEKLAMLKLAGETLEAAGYVLIGMDHFALPDDPMAVAQRNGTLHRNFQGYSLHGDADLLGMGVSAISAFDDFYAQNLKVLSNWQEAVQAGRMPIERGFLLDWDDRLRRDVIMGLLCDLRLDLVAFRQRWEVDFADYFKDQLAALGEFEKLGLIDMNGPVLKVTDTGRLVVRALVMLFDRYAGTPNPQRFSRII